MAAKNKLVEPSPKTNRETFAAPYVAADYDAAVFTSPEGMAPTVDAMFTSMMALSANVWAIQRRLRIMEILMEKNGKVTREMVEQYMPTAAEKEQLEKERNAFVNELYDPFKAMGTMHYAASIDVPDATVKKAL
jgi:hypothetical protein